MAQFRRKPIIIDAEQFFESKPLPFRDRGPFVSYDGNGFYVVTTHGQKVCLTDGDWVVPEGCGFNAPSFAAYPIKPDIFEATYDLVEPTL